MKHEILSSELSVSKNCNCPLSEKIVQLERNLVNTAQFHGHELLEINPIPTSTGDDILENSISKVFSETNDFQTCHLLKKKDTMIVKFKYRKQKHSIFIKRNNLCNKLDIVNQLNFFGRLLPSERISHKNHQLPYISRQLKNANNNNSKNTWDKLWFSCEIVPYGKSSISIFQ